MFTAQALVEVFGGLVGELNSSPALLGFFLIAAGLLCLVMSGRRAPKEDL
jgi:hypothetical protein